MVLKLSELGTFGAVLRFSIRLESYVIKFYEDAALNKKCSEVKEVFLAFAREDKRSKELLERIRQEVVTDAVKTGFGFTGLKRSDYVIEMKLTPNMNYLDILRLAMELEEKAYRFYLNSASKASSLFPDVERTFEKLAREKADRKLKLKSLHEKATLKLLMDMVECLTLVHTS